MFSKITLFKKGELKSIFAVAIVTGVFILIYYFLLDDGEAVILAIAIFAFSTLRLIMKRKNKILIRIIYNLGLMIAVWFGVTSGFTGLGGAVALSVMMSEL